MGWVVGSPGWKSVSVAVVIPRVSRPVNPSADTAAGIDWVWKRVAADRGSDRVPVEGDGLDADPMERGEREGLGQAGGGELEVDVATSVRHRHRIGGPTPGQQLGGIEVDAATGQVQIGGQRWPGGAERISGRLGRQGQGEDHQVMSRGGHEGSCRPGTPRLMGRCHTGDHGGEAVAAEPAVLRGGEGDTRFGEPLDRSGAQDPEPVSGITSRTAADRWAGAGSQQPADQYENNP